MKQVLLTSIATQIDRITRDREIKAFVTASRVVIQKLGPRLSTRRGVASLESKLNNILKNEVGGAKRLARKLRDDSADEDLCNLGNELADLFIHSPFRRGYSVKLKCPICSALGQPKVFYPEPFKTTRYIPEEDFRESGLFAKELEKRKYCSCGAVLNVTGSSNVIIPNEPGIVWMISMRMKSAGRMAQKIADVLCYDPDERDPNDELIRLRNLYDIRGMRIIPIATPGLPDRSEVSPVEYADCLDQFKQDRRNLLRLFRQQFGSGLNSKLQGEQVQDALCHALYDQFERRVGSDRLSDLQVKLEEPNASGYRDIQVVVDWNGVAIEVQFVPHDMHLASKDPNSPVYHATYAEIEEALRKRHWKRHPKYQVVCDLFEKILSLRYNENGI